MPAYLPAAARSVVPFARAYAADAARRYDAPLADCWDAAVTALLRASVYFRPGAGRFHTYAKTAVIRGVWRYCRPLRRTMVALDDMPPQTNATASPEAFAVAFETLEQDDPETVPREIATG